LRIPEKHQKYRYAKKTQLSLEHKNYRYVGEITAFWVVSKPVVIADTFTLRIDVIRKGYV